MDLNEYQKLAMRTKLIDIQNRFKGHYNWQLMEGLMGLNGEAGEAIELLKKYIFQGHLKDYHESMIEELGDCLWYIALAADAIDIPLSKIAEYNIEKLKKRYPNGFSEERSENRDLYSPLYRLKEAVWEELHDGERT